MGEIGQSTKRLASDCEDAIDAMAKPTPFAASELARAEESGLLRDYNMLMSALNVSVSKHLFTENFDVVWANDFYFEMTGYSREEYARLFHNSVGEYFARDRDEYERLAAGVMAAAEAGEPGYECLVHMPQKGGAYRWIRVVSRFTDEAIDGVPVIYATFTSVNDVVQMERERSITYDNLPGFVARYRVGEDGLTLLYGNDRFVEFFGARGHEEANRTLQENLAFNDGVIGAHYAQLRRGESVTFEVKARSVRGEDAYFAVYADCIDRDGEDPIYLVLYLDTSEEVKQRRLADEANAKLRRLAFVDGVTGGRNATSFEIEAGNLVRAAAPGTYAIASIDIQKFKVVNDVFGIETGNNVLGRLYHSFEAHLREGEIVARITADAFSVLLHADKPDVLEQRLEEMARAANEAIDMGDGRVYVLTLDAGIYVIDDPGLPMMQIQDRANVARDKHGEARVGRLVACRFYRNADRIRLAREKDIENRMRQALADGEFIVYLQPKLDLRRNAIAGAEALVRWLDPVRGLVPPSDFIPLFERNGFVVELDLHVFRQVCVLLHTWIVGGVRPVPVSVNLSRAHLADPRFLDRFEQIREECGVPAHFIDFELTETLVFEDPQLLAGIIDRLHRVGYRCSMDDFGSGYSSLNVLKDLPVDTLKLDGAFFSGPDLGEERAADVVDVVIQLAKRLHMETVAEGVETERQRAYLEEAGCDMIQGYLFSKPLPVAEFERLAFGEEIS